MEVVRYCRTFNEVADTNIQHVFELIMQAAVQNRVHQAQMPSTLYIVSDMEFDWCTRDASMTNFEYAKQLYRQQGYRLPRVVFWNVQSRNRQQPVCGHPGWLKDMCVETVFKFPHTDGL